MKTERAPECNCGSKAPSGLDHEVWCPYATWFVRALYLAEKAGIRVRPA